MKLAPHLTDGRLVTNHVRLHYVECGTGPPILLLHGFPEFWYSWRRQLPVLAEAGFRAIALDLRGYAQSDQPAGVSNYRVKELVEDIAGTIRGLAEGRAVVVGHDWGGILAWRVTSLHPELVSRLIVLNAPHPRAFGQELMRNPAQWLRSSYTLLFQPPRLPETLLSAFNFALIERAWRSQPINSGAFCKEDIPIYKQTIAINGLTGPLNYYRAAMRYRGDLFGPRQLIEVPNLVIWGVNDPYLSRTLTSRLGPWVPDLRIAHFDNSSHWVQNDVPEQVNRRLLEFLTPHPS